MDRMSPWRKVRAAERFLRMMDQVQAESGDQEEFEDYLGCFLAAVSSAADYVVEHGKAKGVGTAAQAWKKSIRKNPLGKFFWEARDLDVHLSHMYKGLESPKAPRADLSEEVTASFTGKGDSAKGAGVFYYRDLPGSVADTRVVAVCGQYLQQLRAEIQKAEAAGYF